MLKKSNGGNAMKDVSAMGNEPQMPTKDEEIAKLRAEVERLTRVAQAFTEHLHADMKTDLERRLTIPPVPRPELPICPDCGALMQTGFYRVSQNSQSAVKVRCRGNDLSFHEFVISNFGELRPFFPVAAPSAPAQIEALPMVDQSDRAWPCPECAKRNNPACLHKYHTESLLRSGAQNGQGATTQGTPEVE